MDTKSCILQLCNPKLKQEFCLKVQIHKLTENSNTVFNRFPLKYIIPSNERLRDLWTTLWIQIFPPLQTQYSFSHKNTCRCINYLPIFFLLINSTHSAVVMLSKSLQNFHLYLRHTSQINIKTILIQENKARQFSTGCMFLSGFGTSEKKPFYMP